MSKALVIGARGLLGRALVAVLGRAGHAVQGLDHAACDITDAAAVDAALAASAPDVVFLTAAYNAVDRAESEPDMAFRVNATGPGNVARACARAGAFLITYSTDFVFDGAKGAPYTEEDTPRPLSRYGASKLAGEQEALAACASTAVLRTAWLYGAGGSNFPSLLASRLASGQSVRADGERRGSPTWVEPLALQSLAVAERRATGIVHAACTGETTWLGFARALAARLGAPAELVVPTTSAELGLPAQRPLASVLACSRLAELGLAIMPAWDQALAGYLAAAGYGSAGAGPAAREEHGS